MVAFLEIALRLRNAQILPLDSWKAVPAPGSSDAATRTVQRWSFISNLQHGYIRRNQCCVFLNMSVQISSIGYLFSGVLNMTKHSSRLILKISCFIINSSELVLRNKIRFVARIYVECKFDSSPSGYYIEQKMFFQYLFWLLYCNFFFSGMAIFYVNYNTNPMYKFVSDSGSGSGKIVTTKLVSSNYRLYFINYRFLPISFSFLDLFQVQIIQNPQKKVSLWFENTVMAFKNHVSGAFTT